LKPRPGRIAKSGASLAVAHCTAAKVRSFLNISLSSAQNGALVDAEFFSADTISEIAKQAHHDALLSNTYHCSPLPD
jgi:hypothetical protein